jgi:hypothetical protein
VQQIQVSRGETIPALSALDLVRQPFGAVVLALLFVSGAMLIF